MMEATCFRISGFIFFGAKAGCGWDRFNGEMAERLFLLIDRARDSDSKVGSRRSVYISEPLRRTFLTAHYTSFAWQSSVDSLSSDLY